MLAMPLQLILQLEELMTFQCHAEVLFGLL